jgi:hypothetical protein
LSDKANVGLLIATQPSGLSVDDVCSVHPKSENVVTVTWPPRMPVLSEDCRKGTIIRDGRPLAATARLAAVRLPRKRMLNNRKDVRVLSGVYEADEGGRVVTFSREERDRPVLIPQLCLSDDMPAREYEGQIRYIRPAALILSCVFSLSAGMIPAAADERLKLCAQCRQENMLHQYGTRLLNS